MRCVREATGSADTMLRSHKGEVQAGILKSYALLLIEIGQELLPIKRFRSNTQLR